ncbi:cytidylyltransferase domain-containing protein [Clostridium sp.]|jgi:spore coat polysaccharide biosynthesis protein SpsF|uniref:cytidylyltransferase domain-containing protein n=1 Tax=Clostridium sp. TaxID=1506 RepID=UPI003EEBFDD3
MKTVCIVQARVGSKRLPGKVLKEICGKTVLEHDIDRLKATQNINEIVIATTNLEQDNDIVEVVKKSGIAYFRGSEQDVLSRYYYAAKENDADVIIRVTSDCPVIDPLIIDKMIIQFLDMNKESNIDYLSNTIDKTFPRGLDVEVFKFEVLERCFFESKEDYEREHVTPYIYLNLDKFNVVQYKNDVDYSKYRWTLDTEEDFEVIKQIYNNLYQENSMFYFEDILRFILKNPEIAKINENIEQKKLGQ